MAGYDEVFDSPADFAASAANVERTDDMIYCEELEAVSLSATSAAIAAAVFLLVCPAFAKVSFDVDVVAKGFVSPT